MKTTKTRTWVGIWTVAGGAGEVAVAVVAAGIVSSKKQISFCQKRHIFKQNRNMTQYQDLCGLFIQRVALGCF